MKDIYTTTEVARLIHVSVRTVAKLFDAGRIKGFRIGSTTHGPCHRRIPAPHLRAFLKENGLEYLMGQTTTNVILIGLPPLLVVQLRARLSALHGYAVAVADSAFDAGHCVSESPPAVVVVDVAGLGREWSRSIAACLRRSGTPPQLLALLAEDDEGDDTTRMLYDGWLQKPVDVDALVERIKGATE